MATNPKPLLSHPGWWQVGDNIVILIPWVEMQVIVGTRPHRPIGVDGPLGFSPGSSRGVYEGTDIISFAGFHILLKEAGVFLFMFFPYL